MPHLEGAVMALQLMQRLSSLLRARTALLCSPRRWSFSLHQLSSASSARASSASREFRCSFQLETGMRKSPVGTQGLQSVTPTPATAAQVRHYDGGSHTAPSNPKGPMLQGYRNGRWRTDPAEAHSQQMLVSLQAVTPDSKLVRPPTTTFAQLSPQTSPPATLFLIYSNRPDSPISLFNMILSIMLAFSLLTVDNPSASWPHTFISF